MLLLLVDTAGTAGSVLLARSEADPTGADNPHILATRLLPPREFSTQMIPAMTEIFAAAKCALADVDGFAVVSGPGSFTGLRVGLSAVKAFAEATGKPIVAMSRLAVVVSMAGVAGPVHAVLDAGRGEFYLGIYRDAGRTCVAESLETLAALQEIFRSKSGQVVAFEPSVLAALAEFAPTRISEPSAKDALPLARAAWHGRRFCDVASLDANYLRQSNPEIRPKSGLATPQRIHPKEAAL